MKRLLVAMAGVISLAGGSSYAQGLTAATAFERLKALEGEWVDADGFFGKKGALAVTYRVTGGGTAIMEAFPAGTPAEMLTVYHKDGNDLVLTHYCSEGNQPRMRASQMTANSVSFDFAGGTNIDPNVTSHMHAVKIEFLGPDEIRATWVNWDHGKEAPEHRAVFRVTRKK